MNNFYVSFLTYLNLIFVAAKLWDRIDWGWGWVMSPLIAMTVLGLLAYTHGLYGKNRMRADITSTLTGLQDLVRKAKEKEKESARRTVN